MITAYIISYLKERNPGRELFYININNEEYVFRTITPKEYQECKELPLNKYEFEDLITQLSVVYPEKYISQLGEAGIPTIISEKVIEYSLLDGEYVLSDFNEISSQWFNTVRTDIGEIMKCIIMAANPNYTDKLMDSWVNTKLIHEFHRAMFILDLRGQTTYRKYVFDEKDKDGDQKIFKEVKPLAFNEKIEKLKEAGLDPYLTLINEYKDNPKIVDTPIIMKHFNEEAYNALKKKLR